MSPLFPLPVLLSRASGSRETTKLLLILGFTWAISLRNSYHRPEWSADLRAPLPSPLPSMRYPVSHEPLSARRWRMPAHLPPFPRPVTQARISWKVAEPSVQSTLQAGCIFPVEAAVLAYADWSTVVQRLQPKWADRHTFARVPQRRFILTFQGCRTDH